MVFICLSLRYPPEVLTFFSTGSLTAKEYTIRESTRSYSGVFISAQRSLSSFIPVL